MALTREERDEIRKRADGLIRLAAYDSSGSGKRRRAIADDAIALLDALDEAEATITGLRAVLRQAHEALKQTSPYVDNRPWEGPFARAEGRTEALAALRDALARPEFPDTEKG